MKPNALHWKSDECSAQDSLQELAQKVMAEAEGEAIHSLAGKGENAHCWSVTSSTYMNLGAS